MTATGTNWKKSEPIEMDEEGKFVKGITLGTSDNGFLFHCDIGSIWLPKSQCPRAYANEEATVELVFIPRWLIEKEPRLKGV